MKEITRIHVAKIAYDIELDAKKAIQQYINALERYTDDREVLEDIEIRITELLAERGVQPGGIITEDDVAGVRERLGEPTEFAPEEANDSRSGARELEESGKRMYRDVESGLVGGVLAGMARYFGVDPVWVRLIFLVLLVASFGTAFIVYVILWLIIPPARTAADKLRMSGQSVTLASIKALNQLEDAPLSEAAKTTRRVFLRITGIGLLLGAILSLGITLFIGSGLLWGTSDHSPIAHWRPMESPWLVAAFSLFIIAGLLLTALLSVLADATLRIRWNRRTSVIVMSIIVAGLLTFIGGVGTVWYGNWQQNARVDELRETSYVNLPANFKQVTALSVSSSDEEVQVEYIVSDKPRYELDAVPGIKPQITVSNDSTSATVRVRSDSDKVAPFAYWGSNQPVLRIYGPALDTLEVHGYVRYYNSKPQSKLSVTVRQGGTFQIDGSYDSIIAITERATSTGLNSATIQNLKLDNRGSTTVGVVRTLAVTLPDVCPITSDEEPESRIEVRNVSSGKLFFNGKEHALATINTDCGSLVVTNSHS